MQTRSLNGHSRLVKNKLVEISEPSWYQNIWERSNIGWDPGHKLQNITNQMLVPFAIQNQLGFYLLSLESSTIMCWTIPAGALNHSQLLTWYLEVNIFQLLPKQIMTFLFLDWWDSFWQKACWMRDLPMYITSYLKKKLKLKLN